jgi:hypothetical protein
MYQDINLLGILSVKFPNKFSKPGEDSIQKILSSGKPVLVVTTLASPAFKDLSNLLDDPLVSDSLNNFHCFHVPFGADECEQYSLFKPAALYILENGERPSRQLVNNGRGVLFVEDVIQFLEDSND